MPAIERVLQIMARLRDPRDGCPWDVQQDFASIAPYTLEEAYEVADAIERGDLGALRDELGDLLLQVVYHARMAEEAGLFDFEQVAEGLADKLVRRHPHVFGELAGAQDLDLEALWEHQKRAERGDTAQADEPSSALDGVTRALPALVRAQKLQRRAARVGFDWEHGEQVLDKIAEEVAELRDAWNTETAAEELGDLLFAVVNLARHLSVDAETALRAGNAKFERRFRAVEARLAAQGRNADDCTLAELDALWEEVKRREPR